MKSISLKIGAIAASILLLNACSKEPKKMVNAADSNAESRLFVQQPVMERSQYMESLPLFDMSKLPDILKNIDEAHTKVAAVWGIGTGNKVWKWNGSSWYEPNPAAGLAFVDVSEYGGGVWGVGTDQRVYKWNGSSWSEPNAAARLYKISAFDGSVALGMGYGGTLYITYNGGAAWYQFTTITNVMDFSVGNTVNNFCWVVQLNSGTYKLYNYDYTTSSWNFQSTPSVPRAVAAIWAGGAWYLQNGSTAIYRKNSNSGTFTQPNPAAGLYQISAYGDDLNAWGIGGSNRIFKTVNGGASWSEPNPAARLLFVSCGYE